MKMYESPFMAENLNRMANDINDWAVEKGFWDIPEGVKQAIRDDENGEVLKYMKQLIKTQKAALITTETSELIEGIRKPARSQIEGFNNEEEEMADMMIRILDYCGRYNLRIGEAIVAKMAVNEGRPFKHGKNF